VPAVSPEQVDKQSGAYSRKIVVKTGLSMPRLILLTGARPLNLIVADKAAMLALPPVPPPGSGSRETPDGIHRLLGPPTVMSVCTAAMSAPMPASEPLASPLLILITSER